MSLPEEHAVACGYWLLMLIDKSEVHNTFEGTSLHVSDSTKQSGLKLDKSILSNMQQI